MAQQTTSKSAINNRIKAVHPFGLTNPESYPPWSIKACIKYLLWFPIEFPLTMFMCIVGWLLAGYGWLKLKRNTEVTPIPLNSALFSDDDNHRRNGVAEKNSSVDDHRGNGVADKELISIIISCFNESANIELCLLFLLKYCHRPDLCEVILVDGGSTDGWIESLQNGLLKSSLSMKVTIYPFSDHQCSGRGVCQNIGVQKSNGNLLFFVHADTVLFDGYDEYIRSNLKSNDQIVIGSFKFTVNRSLLNAPLVGLGTMELFARIRNDCYWLPYGDQTYFVQKQVFTALLKGFKNDLVAMEDLVMTSNARKLAVETGNVIFVSDHKAYCSPRRWQKNGVSKNTMWNQIIVFCWAYLGYTPAECYKLYYGVDVPPNKNKDIKF